MKKILTGFLIIIMVFIISGCGEKKVTPEPVEWGLGDTITLEGFKVTFINYSIREPIRTTSKYSKLIFLEVEVTNTRSKENKFPIANYEVYNTKDLKIEKIGSGEYSTSIHLGTIMPKGTTSGHIIFPFDGYGIYTLIFKDKTHNEKFKLKVYEDNE